MIGSAIVPGDVEARILKVLAHSFRLQVLEVLSIEEECVCHLSALFDRPQPYVSQHLAAIKEVGLVADRRVAQRIYYRVTHPRMSEFLAAARALAGAPHRINEHRTRVSGCPCPKCSSDAG